MKSWIAAALIGAFLAAPAQATGGLTCRTAGPQPIEVAVGFGHVAGAPLIARRLRDGAREIPVAAPQWWLDDKEIRLVLTDPDAMRREAVLRAQRNGPYYDGSLWRGGKRRWVRCRDS